MILIKKNIFFQNPVIVFVLIASFFIIACSNNKNTLNSEKHLKPYNANQWYWQFKGEPVLLLGATDNDNLFQTKNVKSHLDSLADVGGNYIRNTMSDRDPGDLRAFALNSDGKYDLNKWNDAYWQRLETMLQLAKERDIIVQIEIWDRFDHSRNQWLSDPFNPANNVNYTYTAAGLDSLYPSHPGKNEQPFFFTIPELDNNKILLNYQKSFVKKLLSVSLQYDNVLYCIDNETSGVEEWAIFWNEFLIENSNDKEIFITQMWDDWDITSDVHKRTLDHPQRYGYVDISQNSHNSGQMNWDKAQYIFTYLRNNPRPLNSTKIYGSDTHEPWLHRGMTTEHAVQTFFRNIIGGFASSRFHRPPHGLGLSQPTINSIKTIRKIEEYVKMWEIIPTMDQLQERDANEAYLAAKQGEKYVIYFPENGQVKIDLSEHKHTFVLRWITTEDAAWKKKREIKGGRLIDLNAKNINGSIAVLTRK